MSGWIKYFRHRSYNLSNSWSTFLYCVLSRVRLFATTWTVACQASLSMGFPSQKYCSGLPFPSPGDLPNPGIEPTSLVSSTLQADSLPTEPLEKPICMLKSENIQCLLIFIPEFSTAPAHIRCSINAC